jgi:uncharacterized membrane protein YgdD (TMEM256/DUF423 family)
VRTPLALGALFGFLAVAFGAFGAHALRDRLAPDLLDIFETGARYQMFHALALLLVAALTDRLPPRPARTATIAFALGIVVFSGSLYILALTGVRAFGAVTPVGGAAFLVGWLALLTGALRRG